MNKPKPTKRTTTKSKVGVEKPTSHASRPLSHAERLYGGALSHVVLTKGRMITAADERLFAGQHADASRMFREKAIEHGAKPEWIDVPRKIRTMVLRLLSEQVRHLQVECSDCKVHLEYKTEADRALAAEC